MSIKLFTPTKKAYLYFYSINEKSNSINFLFIKNVNTNEIEKYGIIQTEIDKKDGAPLFGISRKLTNTFYKLFEDETLKNLNENKIEKIKDLLPKDGKELSHFNIWEDKEMKYWLDKFSENIIQYDDIDNVKIYFLEIPELNIDNINNKLKCENLNFSFKYINNDEELKNIQIESNTNEIINKLKINQMISHIKETKDYLTKNEGDLYIIFACKSAGSNEKGFFHFPSLLQGIYRRNKEKWIYCLPSKNEYPTEEMLSKAKCIIIPGSDLSVHNEYQFLRDTEKFFKQLIIDMELNNKYPQLKILGICFGLEIIMNAFGGKLNNGKWDKKSKFGPEEITLNDEFWELPYVKKTGLEKKNKFYLSEAHSEQIIEYPEEKNNFFKTIGFSNDCQCEVSVDKNNKIFMLQGHPEYSPGLELSRSIIMMMTMFSGMKESDINDESIRKFEEEYFKSPKNNNIDYDFWRAVCDTFMRYKD